jgi:hypothetical protein
VRYGRRVAPPPEGVGLWAPLHVHFHEFRIPSFLLHCLSGASRAGTTQAPESLEEAGGCCSCEFSTATGSLVVRMCCELVLLRTVSVEDRLLYGGIHAKAPGELRSCQI